jgi:hypothetical protein
MSETVKLAAKMPKDFEMNGLDAQAEALIDDPKTLRCGVVWYDTRDVNINTDTGAQVPTVRIRRFEPLGDADDVSKAIREAVGEAIQARTGRAPIPWDIVEVVDGDQEAYYGDTLPEGDED